MFKRQAGLLKVVNNSVSRKMRQISISKGLLSVCSCSTEQFPGNIPVVRVFLMSPKSPHYLNHHS
ncbi:MAG: hypothetical protein L0922_07280, partial [Candidatus Mariimomonas ferrooxydans]